MSEEIKPVVPPLPQNIAAGRAQAVRVELRIKNNREVTCEHCGSNADCDFAFDLYNTDGDCLAIK